MVSLVSHNPSYPEKSSGLRILIIDDDELLLQHLGLKMQTEGHVVALASSGVDALNMIEGFAPQLVLVDWMMEGMDGLEVCRELRKTPQGKLLYIMIFTQYGNDDLLVEAFEADVDDYVIKPVVFRLLNARIRAGERLIKLQQEVERERRNSHRYLDTVDVIIIGLDESLDITLVNRKGCDVLGYSEREILNLNWCDKFIPREEAHSFRNMCQSLDSGKSSDLGEYESYILTRDNEKRLIAWHTSAITEQDKLTDILCCGIDITAERIADLEGSRLAGELAKAKKTQAIGNLVGGVAHNFNNMLASIMGYAELGLQFVAAEKDSPVKKYFEKIHTSGNEAKQFVGSLLSLNGQAEVGNKSALLAPLLEDVERMIVPVLSSRIQVKKDYAGLSRFACVNQDLVHQMLSHLCLNAQSAMGGEGEISLGLHQARLEPIVCSSCHESFSGEFVELSVADHGAGMSEDLLESVFNPFFSTGQIIGRLDGLGLPLVHGMMHASHGHIVVDSAIGKGTTIRLLFPVSESCH